jgi:hypothetical protein
MKVSEKLNLPLAVFTVEALSITLLTTLGLMTTTLVAISSVAMAAFVWNRSKGIQARTGSTRSINR